MKLRRNRKGVAIVEFAIGLGVLITAFMGTFRFGYTFFQYNQLENAVIRGARFASIVPYHSAGAPPSAAFLTSVQNMVLYGSPTAGTSPILTGLTAANVNLSVTFS